jgi:hypothetical protein
MRETEPEMTETEAVAELERLEKADGPMSDGDRKQFENLLCLRAYVRGWTGDPLQQPAPDVLAAYRQMRAEQAAGTES